MATGFSGVLLTRFAHPVELGTPAGGFAPVAADGCAPAGAAVATATVRAATATKTSHTRGNRHGRCDISITTYQTGDIRCQSVNKPHRATAGTVWLDPATECHQVAIPAGDLGGIVRRRYVQDRGSGGGWRSTGDDLGISRPETKSARSSQWWLGRVGASQPRRD